MKMKNWFTHTDNLNDILKLLSIRDRFGANIDQDKAFDLWRDKTLMVRSYKRTVYFIGNGASASMASHVSADLAKNARMHTEVFSDLSLITAIANDMGYDEVFAEPLRRRMVEGDMLVAISSSGSSPNILRAVDEAVRMGGFVISLSAMNRDNELSSRGNLNFYVPASTYGTAETCHAAILHYWIDMVAAVKAEIQDEYIISKELETLNL